MIIYFRYVSDHAYNGFKAVCQHKLLSCMGIEGPLCRFYPPTSLEWKATKKRAAMAMEAKLPNSTYISSLKKVNYFVKNYVTKF